MKTRPMADTFSIETRFKPWYLSLLAGGIIFRSCAIAVCLRRVPRRRRVTFLKKLTSHEVKKLLAF